MIKNIFENNNLGNILDAMVFDSKSLDITQEEEEIDVGENGADSEIDKVIKDEIEDDADFESKHARSKAGKFKKGTGKSGSEQQPIEEKKEEKTSQETEEQKTPKIEIDFTKDNILPTISKEDAEMLGVEQKPYLLKKNIIEQNRKHHKDLSEEKEKEILIQALYGHDKIIQDAKDDKENYYHFAKFVDGYNYLVLVDFTPNKENNEIVHYHIMRKNNFMKLLNKSKEKGKEIYE